VIQQLVAAAAQVPAVIWSAVVASVVGSGLTLSGVLLSNRGNTQRLTTQLAHDSDERAAERKAVLRREVYLKAVEELVKANRHMMNLPKLDPADTDLSEGLDELFAVTAKLQLIANPKTARLIEELSARYSELVLTLLPKVQPIHDLQRSIGMQTELMKGAQAEADRVLAAMAQLNESSDPDPTRFAMLDRSMERIQARVSNCAKERDALWAERNALHQRYIRAVLHEMKRIAQVQIPVMAALREELGVENDSEDAEQQIAERFRRMEMGLNNALLELGIEDSAPRTSQKEIG
jgi:hypothetical protein